MSWVIKKDRRKGRYKIWSTIVDAVICDDATRQEVIDVFRADAASKADAEAARAIDKLQWERAADD